MNKYIITIRRNATATMLVAYDAGMLKLLEIQSPGLSADQITWMQKLAPAEEIAVSNLPSWYEFVSIEPVPTDLSFNAFWEQYGYKVGRKERAIRCWMALDEGERAKCMRSIPRYKAWLAQKPTIEMLYPETFLSQKRYLSEFKL